MDFSLAQSTVTNSAADTLIIPLSAAKKLNDSAQALDENCAGLLSKLLKSGDLSSKLGDSRLLLTLPNLKALRVICIGMGDAPLSERDFIKFANAAASALKNSAAAKAEIFCSDIQLAARDSAWALQQFSQILADSEYRFTECKSKPEAAPKSPKVIFNAPKNAANQGALNVGKAIAEAMAFAKTLGNLPGNVATPSFLADQAKNLAKQHGLTIKVLDEDKMAELGMGSFLSVSAGSMEPAKLICLQYKGGDKKDAPHMLVGKGITFDTGGISLKPGADMDQMKFDMCGAASVLGTLQAVAQLKLPINLVAIIAAAENMPSGHATKPGDIVTAMNGTTIEILNTDAEGRLVLCDALTYGIKTYKPATVVDIATLTGACMMALGSVNSGLFTEDEELAAELLNAGLQSQDRVWRLPLEDDYQDSLDSNFADIANIGSRLAGATTAACFLSRFTKGQRWAHLDIAGTSWNTAGKQKGSNGRPVPLLVNYLLNKTAQ
ncbi:MAG: leucyl aminopeptidase [Oceanospirillaceae bacterium]|nr:leucyl aminopeptidase [Oceanospirillaceae bacterium]MCP5349833.1 leucyl aminopeptidase [Oceanospirillaceae bacterium]